MIRRRLSALALVTLLVSMGLAPAFALDFYAQHPSDPFNSTTLQEGSPVQTAASAFPAGVSWVMKDMPSISTYRVPFSGTPGQKAGHEGMDFVHNDPKVPHVPVIAADNGTVAYVRTGAPQASMFQHNTSMREAGAGWGNHVVIAHGNGVYTRYAHLYPGSIKLRVGDVVKAGDVVGEMGNSGRSETRHLHFEVGYKKTYFVPNKPAQSFDLVLSPEKFFPGKAPAKPATKGVFVSDKNNVRSGPGTTNQVYDVAVAGTPFSIVAREGEWLKVRYTKCGETTIEGWTHLSNVKLLSDQSNVPPRPSSDKQFSDSGPAAVIKTAYITRQGNRIGLRLGGDATEVVEAPVGTPVKILADLGSYYQIEVVLREKTFVGDIRKTDVQLPKSTQLVRPGKLGVHLGGDSTEVVDVPAGTMVTILYSLDSHYKVKVMMAGKTLFGDMDKNCFVR